MADASLPLGLDRALSLEDGLQLLSSRMFEIDQPTLDALRAAASTADTTDPAAAADLHAWAGHARALLAWRVLVDEAPASLEEFQAKVASAQPDEPLAQLCVDVLESELAGGGEPTTLAQVASAVLSVAADITARPRDRAYADYAAGRLLFIPQAWAERRGDPADQATLAAARQPLTECADNPDAPTRLRAEALSDLAWIAGADAPDEVARLQARSEELLATASDRDLDALRRVRRDRAWWAVQRGDHAEALRLHRANLDDAERDLAGARCYNSADLITRGNQPDHEGAIDAASELGDSIEVVELIEDAKARAFHHAASLLVTGPPSTSPHLARRRKCIEDAVDTLLLQLASRDADGAGPAGAGEEPEPQAQPDEGRPGGDELRAELDELIDSWSRNEQRRRGPVLVRELACAGRRTVAQIAELLPAGVCYLSYHWTPGRLLIGVIDADGLVGEVTSVDVPPDELGGDRLARAELNVWMTIRLRGSFRSADELQRALGMKLGMFWPDDFLRVLHGYLIAPIAETIAPYHTLVISPPRQLAGLPFHCLSPEAGRVLLEEKAIVYVAGARHLCTARRRRHATRGPAFVAATGPSHGGPALASDEADATAALLNVQTSPATGRALRTVAPSAGLLHLACHTEGGSGISSDWGLRLEDGLITADEIRALSLEASLATLSACDGAALDIDPRVSRSEFNGLIGALLQAGVPAVVATRWPLVDKVGAPFARAFYAELAKEGVTPAQALRRAQLDLRKTFDHPYFWAPFSLWGDGVLPLPPPDPHEE